MIAILLTCFNRKRQTLRCLESIYRQNRKEDMDIYLCDDGSTDGTAESVATLYPAVRIYKGGNLFWNRGMLTVMREAIKKDYRYYLMVNDDVEFFDTMFDTMMSFEEELNQGMFAIVGSTCDNSGNTTYGGRMEQEIPVTYGEVMRPNGKLQRCDVANWNCFLIPGEVIAKIGLLDEIYEHAFGDYDYCYRLMHNNIPVYVAPNFVGKCENNDEVNPLNNMALSRTKRFNILFSNKGLPVKSWYVYTKRYAGSKWVKAFVSPYVKRCIKIILNKPIN